MSNQPAPPIVVIDDCSAHLDFLEALMRHSGYAVAAFGAARSAIRQIAARSPRSSVTEILMPGSSGDDALRRMQREFPGVPIVAVCAQSQISGGLVPSIMQRLDANAALCRPIDPNAPPEANRSPT